MSFLREKHEPASPCGQQNPSGCLCSYTEKVSLGKVLPMCQSKFSSPIQWAKHNPPAQPPGTPEHLHITPRDQNNSAGYRYGSGMLQVFSALASPESSHSHCYNNGISTPSNHNTLLSPSQNTTCGLPNPVLALLALDSLRMLERTSVPYLEHFLFCCLLQLRRENVLLECI